MDSVAEQHTADRRIVGQERKIENGRSHTLISNDAFLALNFSHFFCQCRQALWGASAVFAGTPILW